MKHPSQHFNNPLNTSGHFHIAGPGSLWKQQSKDGEVEAKVLKELNESSLHAYTPDYLGSKEHDGKRWIGMEDVMCHFTDGCGMDIKIGTRSVIWLHANVHTNISFVKPGFFQF